MCGSSIIIFFLFLIIEKKKSNMQICRSPRLALSSPFHIPFHTHTRLPLFIQHVRLVDDDRAPDLLVALFLPRTQTQKLNSDRTNEKNENDDIESSSSH